MTKEISAIIKAWKDEAGVTGIIQVGMHYYKDGKLKICTNKPGLMIGFRGELVNKYTELLNKAAMTSPCLRRRFSCSSRVCFITS